MVFFLYISPFLLHNSDKIIHEKLQFPVPNVSSLFSLHFAVYFCIVKLKTILQILDKINSPWDFI